MVDGPVDAIKVSDEELVELHPLDASDRGSTGETGVEALRFRAEAMHGRTGADVFVTRAGSGAFACASEGALSGRVPRLEAVDHHGAGDSFTAALAVARSEGPDVAAQLRLALAAAARTSCATGSDRPPATP